jgi:GDPmannose 4,6-dehydratase
MPRALIIGVTGQDGSYLSEFLLEKGYQVGAISRKSSSGSRWRIAHIADRLEMFSADLVDQSSLAQVIEEFQPQEVYNLAAMSFVPHSWEAPVLAGEVTGLGVTRVLEAIRHADPEIRFYQASTSEMFGQATQSPQSETTPFHPRSPYAVSKVYGHHITVNYRESYGMYTCSGILFNHESPRRGLEFVTRKITRAAAAIKLGLQDRLSLGNLQARRDWGDARDYVRAMWLMLQQETPGDYVVGTGQARSVGDVVACAFNAAGLDGWQDYVETDSKLLRPAEVDYLVADANKAAKVLGWRPEISFEQMIKDMVRHDLQILSQAKPDAQSACEPWPERWKDV